MNPYAAFLCTVVLGAGLTLAVTPVPTCATAATTHSDLPGIKAPASSFAPHARQRAYGTPIQSSILRRHTRAHRRPAVLQKHARPKDAHADQ
jgi:hypothetical protein